jgi:plastocyanin
MILLALLLAAAPPAPKPSWPGAEMPLPLAVHTQSDLEFKNIAERQYLIFNLLASGKTAYDKGDYASAVTKWDALLGLPGLDPQLEKSLRPLWADAHEKAGNPAFIPPPAPPPAPAPPPEPEPAVRKPVTATVEGTITGGGSSGPGGAVISLKRLDGPMPRPERTQKVILQKDKAFVPRVLAVSVGTSVVFRNDDDINHNVFSLAPRFDTGLYGKDGEKKETFEKPGVVQLLCNIHSAMLGYIVVVDSPWYAQADGAGSFVIKGIPPGEYEVSAWHENASKPTTQRLTVPREGVKVALTVLGDKQPPAYPPDKYGKPRQQQLGY